MAVRAEGHGPDHGGGQAPPLADPTDGLAGVLGRWEASGGVWRVLDAEGDSIAVGLFTCGGDEEVDRVRGARTAALRDFLAGRTSSEDG